MCRKVPWMTIRATLSEDVTSRVKLRVERCGVGRVRRGVVVPHQCRCIVALTHFQRVRRLKLTKVVIPILIRSSTWGELGGELLRTSRGRLKGHLDTHSFSAKQKKSSVVFHWEVLTFPKKIFYERRCCGYARPFLR